MKKKKKRLAILLVGLFFASFGLVRAENNGLGSKINKVTNMSDEEKAAKKDEIKDKIEDRWATTTCKKIETRMRARYEKYETNKALHKQTYDKTKAKITDLIEKLEADGQDVSKVQADLVLLETKLQKLYADHEALIQKMKEMEAGTCTSSKENLGSKIKEVQKYRLDTIKVDIQDIRVFYSTVLRPDLVALINQAKVSNIPTASPATVD